MSRLPPFNTASSIDTFATVDWLVVVRNISKYL